MTSIYASFELLMYLTLRLILRILGLLKGFYFAQWYFSLLFWCTGSFLFWRWPLD